MKKFLIAIGKGLSQGLGIGIAIFAFIEITDRIDRGSNRMPVGNEVISILEVEDARISGIKENDLLNRMFLNLAVRVKNPTGQLIRQTFVDVEFYDVNGEFLFGRDGYEVDVSPTDVDNFSLALDVSEEASVDEISTIQVKLYLMKF